MSNRRNDISILYMAASVLAVSLVAISVVLAMQIRDISEKYGELAMRVAALYAENAVPSASEILETASIELQPEPDPIVVEPESPLTKSEIDLIALVTMAEAEGEPEEGKRLVIDTILNRVDGKYWPDSVTDVIYQPSQFEAMWNGRVERCYIMEDIRELVVEESINRTNSDVVYFRTQRYSSYGTPLFQVGNHYFSAV